MALSVEEVKTEINTFATKNLALHKIACPSLADKKIGGLCYSVNEDAKVFRQRVDGIKNGILRNITGWRDDYGVLNGVFQYQHQPYEVGIGFIRAENFTSESDFDELRKLKSQGYVAIFVTTDKPRDR